MASERTIQPTLEHARDRGRASDVRPFGAAFEAHAPSESAYRTALGAATDGVLLVDHAGVIVYANPAAETFFADDSLLGQFLGDLSIVDRKTLCTIGRELQRERRWRGRLKVRASLPELDVTVERIGSNQPNDSEPEQLCIVVHGAARMETSETDDAASSKLSRFTSEIAHDFNNQIAVILNYTFVLLRHMPADSPLKAHVAEMQAAAWRASQVAQAIHRALTSTQSLLPSSK